VSEREREPLERERERARERARERDRERENHAEVAVGELGALTHALKKQNSVRRETR
jgi:hypothetical protein